MSRNTCNALFLLSKEGRKGDIMWNKDFLDHIPLWVQVVILAVGAILLLIYLLIDRVHRRKAFTNKNTGGKEEKADELR